MPKPPQITIPMPIQVVIDDVGWWSGEDAHTRNEPFRTGIARDHVPADYAAIVSLGRQLNMRPQAAMILCEWDRDNLLRELPPSQWMGTAWDNRRWVGPWLDEAADVIRAGSAHIELTLHGVGHEFWTDGVASRAEWHDKQLRMRPRTEVEAHLDYFGRILDQHGLGPFPESFVPAAFLHCFGAADENLAEIFVAYGIRYMSTPSVRRHVRHLRALGLLPHQTLADQQPVLGRPGRQRGLTGRHGRAIPRPPLPSPRRGRFILTVARRPRPASFPFEFARASHVE